MFKFFGLGLLIILGIPCLYAQDQISALRGLVLASPERVAAHDKQGWLDLFAHDARLQDPVGSKILERGLAGSDPFENFYEVFIGPHDIRFAAIRDYASPSELEILRDVNIVTRLSANCEVSVPAFVYYSAQQQDSGLKIFQLRAYWELSANAQAIAKQGKNCLSSSLKLSRRMIQNLGPQYTIQYAGALGGVGNKGKNILGLFFETLNGESGLNFLHLFEQDARIQCATSRNFSHPEQFWNQYQLGQENWQLTGKLLSAGRHSVARFHVRTATGEERERALLIDFAERDLKIAAVHCFDALETK